MKLIECIIIYLTRNIENIFHSSIGESKMIDEIQYKNYNIEYRDA